MFWCMCMCMCPGGDGGGCDCVQGGVAGSKKCMVVGTFLGVELEMI